MTRRGFLGLAAAVPLALLVPKRTFFLPPLGGWGKDYLHRELTSLWVMGMASSSIPATLKVFRGEFELLRFAFNAYGGALRFVPRLGEEPVEVRGQPFRVECSTRQAQWGMLMREGNQKYLHLSGPTGSGGYQTSYQKWA